MSLQSVSAANLRLQRGKMPRGLFQKHLVCFGACQEAGLKKGARTVFLTLSSVKEALSGLDALGSVEYLEAVLSFTSPMW